MLVFFSSFPSWGVLVKEWPRPLLHQIVRESLAGNPDSMFPDASFRLPASPPSCLLH